MYARSAASNRSHNVPAKHDSAVTIAYIDRDDTSRRRKRPPQHPEYFPNVPMLLVLEDELIGIASTAPALATRLEQPESQRCLIGSKVKNGVIELARHRQRPPVGTQRERVVDRQRGHLRRRRHGQRREMTISIELHVDVPVADRGFL